MSFRMGPTFHSSHSWLLVSGYKWWVRGTKLFFKSPPADDTGLELVLGSSESDANSRLDRVQFRFSGVETASSVEVAFVDPSSNKGQVRVTKVEVPGSPGLGGESTAVTELAKTAQSFAGKRGGNWLVDSAEGADQLAKGMATRIQSDRVVVKGETQADLPFSQFGKIKLKGVGDRLEGSYIVNEWEYLFVRSGESRHSSRTRFVAGGSDAIEMADLLGGGTPAGTPWGNQGLVVGTVTSLGDEDHKLAVKVSFPTIGGAVVSAWARVMAVGAGSKKGLKIYPAVNDDVVVGFEMGDPSRPVILGGLWHKVIEPPSTSEKEKEAVYALRSAKGHMIEILDGDDPKDRKVVVKLSDDKTILTLAEDKVSLVAPTNISIESEKGDLIFTAKKDVKIEGQNVTITAKAKAALKAPQIEAKGDSSVKIESSATTEIKGQAALNLNGGASVSIKGGTVAINQ